MCQMRCFHFLRFLQVVCGQFFAFPPAAFSLFLLFPPIVGPPPPPPQPWGQQQRRGRHGTETRKGRGVDYLKNGVRNMTSLSEWMG